MAEQSRPPVSTLGQALGKVPSGIYILTVRNGERATGMLASWVQQAGFEPPMITVALGAQRYIADWVVEAHRFTLNQLPAGSKALLRHFGRGFAPDDPAFDEVELRDELGEAPVLAAAVAYLDAEVVAEIPTGDHRVIVARVIAGAVLHPDADPMTHVRHNGFHY